MASYYDLLKDIRWLKKRKRILKRDGNKCTVCGSNKELKIHHTYYLKKKTAPWDYPDISLLTLCNVCHEKYHKEHELIIQKQHISSGKNKKKKAKLIPKPKKVVTLKDLYKTWEPKLKGRKHRLLKYDI